MLTCFNSLITFADTLIFKSQVKFILPTCKTKVGTGGKRVRPYGHLYVAPSINNLKRFTLSGISLDVKMIKKKTETHLQQKQHKHRITEKNAKKKQSYINTIIIK